MLIIWVEKINSYQITIKNKGLTSGVLDYTFVSTDNSNIKYVFKPAVSYTVENFGEFKAEVDIGFNDSGFESVCFPVYWSYSL